MTKCTVSGVRVSERNFVRAKVSSAGSLAEIRVHQLLRERFNFTLWNANGPLERRRWKNNVCIVLVYEVDDQHV